MTSPPANPLYLRLFADRSAVHVPQSRSLCRDPDLVPEGERERAQRALVEAVVRNMGTQELFAIASGQLGANALLTAAAARRRDQSAEEERGVSQVGERDRSLDFVFCGAIYLSCTGAIHFSSVRVSVGLFVGRKILRVEYRRRLMEDSHPQQGANSHNVRRRQFPSFPLATP